MRYVGALAAVAAAVLLSGCLSPHTVRADPAVLERLARHGWQEEVHELHSGGWFSPSLQETRYTVRPTGANAAFPGEMRVFSVRAVTLLGAATLLERAAEAIEGAAADHGIELDPDAEMDGERRTAQGLPTRFLLREGSSQERGTLFPEDVRIRIIAEAAEDGRSRTAFVAVGIAQVSRRTDCPIFDCGTAQDLRTWNQVAGDPQGRVNGAVFADGLLHNLVTH